MIDLIFKIINLVIVIILAIYIFKRFFLSYLKHSIEAEHLYLQSLNQELHDLSQSHIKLNKELIHQDDYCLNLKMKIDIWRNSVNEKNEQLIQQQEEFTVKLREKLVEQSKLYALKRVQRQISNQVINKLEDELKNYFKHPEHGSNYLERIIKNFEE